MASDRSSSSAALAALFLGPKGENADTFERLLLEAFRDHVFWRRNFHPEDGFLIREAVRRDPAYQEGLSHLSEELMVLLSRLKDGVPFFSPRYIGHMCSELTMASQLGYIATMLYNPNNVTSEASPVTTQLELEVAAQLARAVGYPSQHWGHLTSGGTVANAEALWVARELKYLPVAVRWAAAEAGVREISVMLPQGERADLFKLDLWQLLNIQPQDAMECVTALTSKIGDGKRALDLLAEHSLSGMGYQSFGLRLEREFKDALEPSVLLVPATAHYSWRKLSRVLGVGASHIIQVPVDARFRMDVRALERTLESLAARRQAVLACVSVMGSTEESAVDRLDQVAELRARLASQRGLAFFHHADAAWGGYAVSITRDEQGSLRPYESLVAESEGDPWPTEDVYRALCALAATDSVTIDPHKLGFVPYAAGAICFRDARVRNLVAVEAPYVFHKGQPDSAQLGRFIFEGSKPGATAAAVWMAHRVLPLNAQGYGRLIARTAQGARILRQKLIAACWGEFRIVPLPEPDISIVCFAVSHSSLCSLSEMNALCEAVHRELSSSESRPARSLEYLVTATTLLHEEYGESLDALRSALGVSQEPIEPGGGVQVLRCTVMNPFLVDEGHVNGLMDDFLNHLRHALAKGLEGSR
jgi:glutamate/tyrosine decarboxylase-like PLP-dependent enzyme